MAKRKTNKGRQLPNNYEDEVYSDRPRSSSFSSQALSIFSLIDKAERIQTKIAGKPADKKTFLSDDLLKSFCENAAGFQLINKGKKLSSLFSAIEKGMTNGEVAELAEDVRLKAESKKQKMTGLLP